MSIPKEQLDAVYKERNMCVALIAQLAKQLGLNCGIKHHEDKPGEKWEDDWRNVFFLDLPTGQVSWHLHISEMENFPTLRPYVRDYDNHSTEEKYRRVLEFAGQGSSSRPPGNRNQKFQDQADEDMHRLLENLEEGE